MSKQESSSDIQKAIDVSFLMTTYNFAPYIAEAVNSLLALDTRLSYEIIVLDDASTDNTWSILSSISDSRLKIIRHEKNQGVDIAINTLFSQAKGRYIARVDGDDRWRSNFLTATMALFESDDSIGLVYGDVAIINEHGDITSAKANLNRPELATVGNELLPLLETSYICAPAVIAKREAWQSVLPWITIMGPGDWLGHLKMANAGWLFAHVDSVIADYRLHAQGMHITYMQSTMGEQSVDKILYEMFSRIDNKVTPQQARHIRARHHQRLAFSYISQKRYPDARRLLWAAVKKRPAMLLEKSVAWQLLALSFGYSNYLRLKKVFRRDSLQ